MLLVGSVIAGAAGNVGVELAGRAIQGGGAALIAPSALTLLMLLFGSSPKELTKGARGIRSGGTRQRHRGRLPRRRHNRVISWPWVFDICGGWHGTGVHTLAGYRYLGSPTGRGRARRRHRQRRIAGRFGHRSGRDDRRRVQCRSDRRCIRADQRFLRSLPWCGDHRTRRCRVHGGHHARTGNGFRGRYGLTKYPRGVW